MDRYRYRSNRIQNPSFSSTLLDFIYQSFDQTDDNEPPVVHSKPMRNVVNQSIEANIRYPCCYSDFSLSEAERIYGFPTSLRPLRTSVNQDNGRNRNIMYDQTQQHDEDLQQPKAKLVKTKSRAMKIFSYLKKGTQPISPGGRLATFLTSFFTTKNATKSKISPPYNGRDRDDHAIGHADNKSKSAVNGRYYPNSVNGDRSDLRPAVKFDRNSISKEVVNMHVTGQHRDVEQTTRNLLKDYQKKVEYVFDSIENNDEDDDETASYSSSDLFELDHLSTIGIDRCMQELPLYETTNIDVNRAIAKGLLE